ncbi:MAG: nucleoside deaminase [Actinomycetales bacterium]|jgi:creatinine deaminase|nr:nucleoside deaminase [Actinomycetales bacterium]
MEFQVGQIFATDEEKLQVAIAEAHLGLSEGGIPIGAALFDEEGRLLGSGHNLRVQEGDASMHGETSAFRNAGRQRSYKKVTLATSLSPCWYCSGLIRQFNIGRVLVGDDKNFMGGQDWVAEHGAEVHVMNDPGLIELMREWIEANPTLWNEDIGED